MTANKTFEASVGEHRKIVNTYHERLCQYIQGMLDYKNNFTDVTNYEISEASLNHIETLLIDLVNDSLTEFTNG